MDSLLMDVNYYDHLETKFRSIDLNLNGHK